MQSVNYVPFAGTNLIKRGWFVRRNSTEPLGELTEGNDSNISFRPEGRPLTSGELAGILHFIQAVKNAG